MSKGTVRDFFLTVLDKVYNITSELIRSHLIYKTIDGRNKGEENILGYFYDHIYPMNSLLDMTLGHELFTYSRCKLKALNAMCSFDQSTCKILVHF